MFYDVYCMFENVYLNTTNVLELKGIKQSKVLSRCCKLHKSKEQGTMLLQL